MNHWFEGKKLVGESTGRTFLDVDVGSGGG